MIEVRVNDGVMGDVLICFDGRVLEFFGHGPFHISRFHVGMLTIAVEGPNRKDRYQVDFAPVHAGRNGVRLILDSDDRQGIEPLLIALHAP